MEHPTSSPTDRPTHLIVFDFDWSLVNENSDTYVVHALDPSGAIWAAAEKRLAQGMQWTALMDWVAGELHAAGHTAADMQAALARLPVLPSALAALSLARQHGAEMRILSDANSVYIAWILDALGLADAFAAVVTNPAEAEADGRLRIRTHQPLESPHGCPLCPTNLCKGAVMQSWLDEMRRDRDAPGDVRVGYVGDGGGDFCPCTRMGTGDMVFARRTPHDGLLRACCKARRRGGSEGGANPKGDAAVVARVVEWGDPQDGGPSLADGFQAFFEP